MSLNSQRVVAVVVAYNRRELLVEVLDALSGQSRQVEAIVVVDNASSDDSAEAVHQQAPNATLIRLSRNTGGAGGFAVGMAAALARHAPDWIWVMDDDTIPDSGALENLLLAAETYSGSDLHALGSRVLWTEGSEHPMNTPRSNPFATRQEKNRASAANSVPVRSLSFVSSMYRADAVLRRGLPVADYFLWNDDFEYSTRILRKGTGLSVRRSIVVHKTKALVSTDTDPGERFYLEVRNKVWLFRMSSGLSLGEKAVYIGASAMRWLRTFVRSSDRLTLRRGLGRGIQDGLRTRPRPNALALLDAGVPTDVLAMVSRLP